MWTFLKAGAKALMSSGIPEKILSGISKYGSKLLEGAKSLFSKAAPVVESGAKNTAKAVGRSFDAGSVAMKTAKEGGEKLTSRLAKGAGATFTQMGGEVLESGTVAKATGALSDVAATNKGVAGKVAGGLSSLIDKAKGSKAAKVAAAGGIATAGLYATGNGEVVENVVDAAGNVAHAGADVLSHAPDAVSAVGSGLNAVTDLVSTVTGAISDLTAGDFSGAISRVTDFAANHPVATAVGLGGGALMLGGGGIIGKVAAVGAGLVIGKTIMDNTAKSTSAEATTSSFASGANVGNTVDGPAQPTADDLTAAMAETTQAETAQAATARPAAETDVAVDAQAGYDLGE